MTGPEAPPDGGSRRRASDTLSYIPPVRERRRLFVVAGATGIVALVVAWLAGFALALTSVIAVDAPADADVIGGVILSVTLVGVLVRRCGGRVLLWTVLMAALVAATLVFDVGWLYTTTAIVTAITSSALAVLITRPATGVARIVAEYLVAVAVAVSGAVAVASWNAPLDPERFYFAVLVMSLVLALAVVWRLGAGLHGLGRTGVLLIVGAAVLLLLLLAYGTLVREYGSPTIVDFLDTVIENTRNAIGGVPRPAEVLIGFPALIWGVALRPVRRQGWWMCAFGVVGTGIVAVSLGSPNGLPSYIGWSTLYSVILGLALGLLICRLDRRIHGRPSTQSAEPTGRRARREEPQLVAPKEPSRFAPLR